MRPDVLERGDHQVPVRVRVEVEDHEAALAAVDDQVRGVVILRGLRAEDALVLESLDASFTYLRRHGAQMYPLGCHTAAS